MDEFTGISSSSSSGLFSTTVLALANKTGVSGKDDQSNVSLHVKGDMSIDGNVHMCSFKTYANSQVSDQRIKTDPSTINEHDAVSQLTQIQIHKYIVNPPGARPFRSIGPFAQDLAKINTVLVDVPNDPESELYSVYYDRIAMLMVPCVQKLLRDNASLQTQMDDALARIEQMQATIDTMKSSMKSSMKSTMQPTENLSNI